MDSLMIPNKKYLFYGSSLIYTLIGSLLLLNTTETAKLFLYEVEINANYFNDTTLKIIG
jgi:hypothetical protein